jgi:hypothetical protein
MHDMGNIVSLEDVRQKRVINGLINGIGEMYSEAGEIIVEYARLVVQDPEKAIDELYGFNKKVRNVNKERAFIESLVGPNQDWTGPIFSLVGNIYPELNKQAREKALRKTLQILDKINYMYVQWDVEKINEPLFVRDIQVSRPIYWPGYEQQTKFLEKNTTWKDFLEKRKELITSDFLLAFAISKPKHASLEIRTKFYDSNKELMDRTSEAIGGILYNESERFHEREKLTLEEYITDNIKKFDPLLHEKIYKAIEEKDWIKIER